MFSGLELTLFLLAAAVLGVVAFRMMQLPPMLGYLVVGIIIGPHGLAFAEDNETTHALAEFGVVFLMFSIGLEFSLSKLSAMRHIVFGLGVAQVAATIATTMLVAWGAAMVLPDSQEGDISHLASPLTGGGVKVERVEQLFLLAREICGDDVEAWPAQAWQHIAAQGKRLVRDGVRLEGEAENLAELATQARLFARTRLPLLRALQVA